MQNSDSMRKYVSETSPFCSASSSSTSSSYNHDSSNSSSSATNKQPNQQQRQQLQVYEKNILRDLARRNDNEDASIKFRNLLKERIDFQFESLI